MTKIIIASHKENPFYGGSIYMPLFVGAEGKEDILNLSSIHLRDGHVFGSSIARDDSGENISEKNPSYCELTGLYWAWKNLDFDVLGMVHYRRYFSVKSGPFIHSHQFSRSVLNASELHTLMEQYDIIVPKKRIYGIETLYSHYDHTLDGYQLDAARVAVGEKYPSYLPVLNDVYSRRWGYMFNMFIMKREDVDAYCTWLFDILDRLEQNLNEEGYLKGLSSFEKRLFGRVSEILFNVWLQKRRADGASIGEVAVISPDGEDWLKKGSAFLKAKFIGKKYKESF